MKNALLLILGLMAFAPTLIAQRRPPIPKPAPKLNESKPGFKSGVVFENYVINITVNPDGTSTSTYEMKKKFSSSLLLAYFSKESVNFNADLDEIKVIEAYKLSPAGKKNVVLADKIQAMPTAQTAAAPGFSSLKVMVIDFGTLKPGETVYSKIEHTTKKTYFPGKYSEAIILPAAFEIKNAEINLNAPSGYELFFEARDIAGGKLREENGRTYWRWTKTNSPALDFQPGIDSLLDLSPYLLISSFKDHAELGRLFLAEGKSKSAITPQIQKLADEITKEAKDPKAQANAIYQWVNKNIRYLAIILDRGGWIPHDADSIAANGYGDCKDYTILLHALLAAKGIESNHILVRSENDFWSPKIALPEAFNHMILYIPSLGLFADATAANTRLGSLANSVTGKDALLISDQSTQIKIPQTKAEDNQFLSDTEIIFARNGAIRSVSKNTYTGTAEMIYRPLFADSRLESRSYFLEGLLQYYGLKGTGNVVNLSDPHDIEEPFSVDFEVKVDEYATFLKKGSLVQPTGLNLFNLLELERLTTAEKLKNKLASGAATFRERYSMKFPDGVEVASIPKGSSIENEVGSFDVEYSLDKNVVGIKRRLILKKAEIEPAEYEKLKELVKATVESYTASFEYSADGSFLKEKIIQRSAENRSKRNIQTKKPAPSEIRQLEAKLAANPDDKDLRKTLIGHYLSDSKLAAADKKKVNTHQLWFIKNYPETAIEEVFGYFDFLYSAEDPGYEELEGAWLEALEAKKDNLRIRLNAAEFFEGLDDGQAEKILSDGEKLFPEKYEFPLRLFKLLRGLYQQNEKDKKKAAEELQRLSAAGERALASLKKARSSERDRERMELLPLLAKTYLDIGNPDAASKLAKELILEFADNQSSWGFGSAALEGNLIIGTAALDLGNIEKAKEHLLIAIRSSLLGKSFSTPYPDLGLAKRLLEKGEKAAVLEFLKLCEGLTGTDTLSLKRWQAETKRGKTPDFEWY